MTKKVIVNSLHSDSIGFIKKSRPQTVVSFDAHPDLGHWNHLEVVKSVIELKIPQRVKSALFRTSIQVLLRIALPQSSIVSVVPEACVITDFNWRLTLNAIAGVARPRVKRFTKEVAISDWKEKLASLLIKGYTSPPNRLQFLLPSVKNGPLALDIDADYLFELTRSCYTPAAFSDAPIYVDGYPRDNLGAISDILSFISLAKPELVTISEIRSEHLKSNVDVKGFLDSLRTLSFIIEDGVFYDDDEVKELWRTKANFDKFYRSKTTSSSSNDFFKAYLDFFSYIGLDT